MKTFRMFLALAGVCVALAMPVASAHAATCGNGIVEGNEECDGVGLFIYGDPDNATCTTGGTCFFQNTCCKFNCQFVGQGPPCDDGDDCSSFDTCDQYGVCQGGPAVINGTPCDDGLFCTGTESCVNGNCTASTGDPCSETACNHCQEATDSCFDPASAACSDGSVCISGGTCDGAGTCVGGVFNSGPCDDGVYCNGTDTCNGGSCSVHTGDPCTGSADSDGNCSESCNELAGNCLAADPDASPCDDGLFCNGADDECSAGVCVGTGSLACDDGNDCTTDGCNEALDSCTTVGTSPDGTSCSDGDACTVGDVCTAGTCGGDPTVLEDLCKWAVVVREQPTRDMIKTRSKVNVTGDLCGGTMRLSGQPIISSDLVADEAAGTPLQLPQFMTVVGDIVTAGGGAKSSPSIAFLPYLTPAVMTLAGGGITAKNDASGNYDLTGTHPLASSCHAARTVYPTVTGDLDALTATDTLSRISLKPGTSTTITAPNPGAVNVIDVDGSIKAGIESSIVLDGGGSANTVMILRVSGPMKLLTLASIQLTGGLETKNTLIYVKGKKCLLNRFAYGYGTLLCSPGRVLTQGAAWIGAIYADGKAMALRDKASVYYLPFQGL